MPSPRCGTAASQLSPVFEDNMRPSDETARVHLAQGSRELPFTAAGITPPYVSNTALCLNELLPLVSRAGWHAHTHMPSGSTCRLWVFNHSTALQEHRVQLIGTESLSQHQYVSCALCRRTSCSKAAACAAASTGHAGVCSANRARSATSGEHMATQARDISLNLLIFDM